MALSFPNSTIRIQLLGVSQIIRMLLFANMLGLLNLLILLDASYKVLYPRLRDFGGTSAPAEVDVVRRAAADPIWPD